MMAPLLSDPFLSFLDPSIKTGDWKLSSRNTRFRDRVAGRTSHPNFLKRYAEQQKQDVSSQIPQVRKLRSMQSKPTTLFKVSLPE